MMKKQFFINKLKLSEKNVWKILLKCFFREKYPKRGITLLRTLLYSSYFKIFL